MPGADACAVGVARAERRLLCILKKLQSMTMSRLHWVSQDLPRSAWEDADFRLDLPVDLKGNHWQFVRSFPYLFCVLFNENLDIFRFSREKI